MAEWLQHAVDALNALPVHEVVRDVEWIVPAVQTIHILAVRIVFSSSIIILLRAFDALGGHWSIARWQRRVEPWTVVALLVLLLSGVVMILAEPERELLNNLFQIKMPLAVIAALITFGLGRMIERSPGERASAGIKIIALLLPLIWAVIMGLGRWIAYAG